MIRRIILELDTDTPLDVATREATVLAHEKQTSVYFANRDRWYRAKYTPPQPSDVKVDPIEGISPMMIFNAPPKA